MDEARAFLIVAAIVMSAAALGLASRHAFSVSFWPANAILVGLMLRWPKVRLAGGWAGAVAGFVAADILFGRPLSLAACFAITNLVGTYAATSLLKRLDPRDLKLLRVHSVTRLLAFLLPGCFAAALGGAVLVKIQFDGSPLQALMTWPASELVNYLAILPAVLTVGLPDYTSRRTRAQAGTSTIWPALFLAASCVATLVFDGPGSIVFPLPALLLCALVYTVPVSAIMTALVGTGLLMAMGLHVIDIGQDLSVPAMVVSVRVAIAFLILVPLTISSAMAVRDDLLEQLRHAADHDGLTGVLNRRAFEQGMRERLTRPFSKGRGLVILWLDIDHFKAINDRHGHPAGDAVLQSFGATARSCCQDHDLVGRLGGEEFALIIDVDGPVEAEGIAERLRKALAAQTVIWGGVPIQATVSIGACHLSESIEDVPALVQELDDALYRAKRQGRDRVEWLHAAPVSDIRMARTA